MKHLLSLAILGLVSGSSVLGQVCNFSSDVIPCTGFVLGQEQAGTWNTYTVGTEVWSTIGQASIPANNGDLAYGLRVQRRQSLALHQIERRAGTLGTYDSQISFGHVDLGNDDRNQPLPRLDFEFIYQTQGTSTTLDELNIATMVATHSKTLTPGGLGLACALPVPCFGRMGIENVNPSYTLDVNGIGQFTGVIIGSDARYKKDVATIESGLDVVNKLRGTTYQYNTEQKFEGRDFDGGIQAGFIAQEVEQVLPHVVYTDEKGYKAVNYIAVIPYLVEAVKTLSAQNAALQAQVEALEQGGVSGKGAQGGLGTYGPAVLYPNVPNPFDQVTEIRFELPASVRAAQLLVFDMNGKQLRKVDVHERGAGSVRIAAGELGSGMYLYTLLADGKEVGTYRMIITE